MMRKKEIIIRFENYLMNVCEDSRQTFDFLENLFWIYSVGGFWVNPASPKSAMITILVKVYKLAEKINIVYSKIPLPSKGLEMMSAL